MATSDGIEVSESEWESLARNWPPVVGREDGSLLVISGIWSTGQRSYRYAGAEVAGMPVGEATARGFGAEIGHARGIDTEDYRCDADAAFDGRGYHDSGKISRMSVLSVPAAVPIRVKIGTMYHSSRGTPHGSSSVHFYGGPTSAPAYRSQSQRFRGVHGITGDAPAPPSPRQIAVLEKYVARAKGWGLGNYRVPRTAAGAKQVLDALAANNWKLSRDGGGEEISETWSSVLMHERRDRERPPTQPALVDEDEYEPGDD